MAKRRRNIFDFVAGLGLASFHTGITLSYRLPMLAASITPQGKARHAREFDRMVSEKTGAIVEGAIDAQREISRLTMAAMRSPLDVLAVARTPFSIADAALRPAFRRVQANSVRLRKSGRPGTSS
jgi:hypothetical protein